jgi:hypothetical protein
MANCQPLPSNEMCAQPETTCETCFGMQPFGCTCQQDPHWNYTITCSG